MRRPLRLAAVVAVAACTVLAGCSQEPLPSPSPRPTNEVVPVLGGDQIDRILGRIVPQIQAADDAKDAALLGPVLHGPAMAGRSAAYTLATRDAALPMPAPIGADRQSAAVPASQEWPRTVLVVTRAGAEDPLPELLLLTQASARDQYKLTAYASMIPRATFPLPEPVRTGVEVVAPEDGEGLAMSPQDAVAAYAKALTEGSASPELEKFSGSPMTDAVFKSQDESREQLTGAACPDCFTVNFTHTPNPANLWAFRTQDGGALVLATIDSSTVMSSNGGAQVTLSQDLRALSGVPVLSTTGTFVYQETVGLFIPPAGPRATISPIAFDRVPISATIS